MVRAYINNKENVSVASSEINSYCVEREDNPCVAAGLREPCASTLNAPYP